MAELTGFGFTGTLGNLSAYKMKGSDKIIIRTKGGASKQKIKKSQQFVNTRRNNAEFGGRSTASKHIRFAMGATRALADYNIAGPINALIKPIQAMDTKSEWGKRNIFLTKNPGLLGGFNLNKRNTFDSIIRTPANYVFSNENLSAHITIPALIPGINLFIPPGPYPLFKIISVLMIVPDITWQNNQYRPATNLHQFSKTVGTGWFPAQNGSPETVLETNIEIKSDPPKKENISSLLTIGICFGTPVLNNEVHQVRYAGAAKVLTMV